ncbi:Rad52/22 double-strand break repair protein, partial [Multifurca ochricompacta]
LDPGSSDTSETSIIQAKLNRRLGPEYVSQRPAPGGGPKLTYVEGWKIIGLANEVFGYNGWCSTVTKIETDFIDIDPESRKCSVGVTAVVKITLKDGTYHEDIGYGSGENIRSKGAALDKAKKEAVTDGVKRALRNFGNLLGLCLYEKLFTQEIVKIK